MLRKRPQLKFFHFLVDDNPNNLVALRGVLAPLGREVVEATSGQDALKRLLDGDFAYDTELYEQADHLRQHKQELVRKRSQLVDAAEESYLKDVFIGVLGHDLRNPLGAIAMASALLKKKTGLDDNTRQLVEHIERAADRMTRPSAGSKSTVRAMSPANGTPDASRRSSRTWWPTRASTAPKIRSPAPSTVAARVCASSSGIRDAFLPTWCRGCSSRFAAATAAPPGSASGCEAEPYTEFVVRLPRA